MHDGRRLTDNEAASLIPLIRGKVKKFIGGARRHAELRQDLLQSAFERLFVRLPHFDPARGSLAAFTANVVDSVLIDDLRYQRAAKRDVRREAGTVEGFCAGSKDRPRGFGKGHGLTDVGFVVGRNSRHAGDALDLLLDFSEALRRLSPEDRHFIERLRCHSVAEIARQDGVSRATGYRRLKAIKQHLEDSGLRQYLPAVRDSRDTNSVSKP